MYLLYYYTGMHLRSTRTGTAPMIKMFQRMGVSFYKHKKRFSFFGVSFFGDHLRLKRYRFFFVDPLFRYKRKRGLIFN